MEGTFKGLALVGASALVVLTVWAVLEKGAFIARLGSPSPEPVRSSPSSHPVPYFNPPPIQKPSQVPVQPSAPKGTATIYKWVDASGSVHFSDRPQSARSEAVTVGQVQIVSMPTPAVGSSSTLVSRTSGRHHQRRISAEDYHFISYVSQRGNYVVFSGRVEYGPSCGRLKLTVRGDSNHGQSVTARTVVENAGGVSKLWEAKSLVGLDRKRGLPSWEVVGVQADCLD